MALNTVGYDNADITVAGFQTLMRYATEGAYRHAVSGMAVSAGGGTRQVVVATGFAVSPGTVTENTATVTKTLDANGTGSARTDYVVLQIDAATDSTTVEVVKGSSAAIPTLTQTLGGVWQIPLATVGVTPGLTTITSGNIVNRRPVPRASRKFATAVTPDTVGNAASAKTVATIAVTDPGWPYRLIVQGAARFADHASGIGILSAAVDGAELVRGSTVNLSLGSNAPAHITETTDTLDGPVTVTLRIQANNMSAGSLELLDNTMNHFTVVQLPA